MRNGSECGPVRSDEAPANKPRRPKRGAFPTPRSEIEKARPYVPDDDIGECPEVRLEAPTDVEGEQEG